MKIIYPYPMQISKGYTYMLSIIQFLNTLAKFMSTLIFLQYLEDIPIDINLVLQIKGES